MVKFKKTFVIGTFILAAFLLVACSQTAVEKEEDYFYALNYIEGGTGDKEEIYFYVIKPFEERVLASVLGENESDAMYDLEDYEDKEDKVTFKYNGITERLEKKSDSLWHSLETGIDYDVKKLTKKADNKEIDW
ncbi:hypothetical protein [Carnobacterium sp. TMP28]|uniref:hypothetical protein n=1 Tax=Carnobacterium sp. TMP28 TaxID=3397060 RepID=UPI0039E1DE41